MPPVKQNTIFILVRPEFLGNIGSVARVLKNFSFSQLRLVDPPRNYKDAEARRMAVDAFDVLKASEVFPTLSDALKDVQVAIGTTSGKQRDLAPVAAIELSSILKRSQPQTTAIVFGNERDGLTREDLLRCHHTTTIGTNPGFSALNLAQAVAIYAYELTRDDSRNAEEMEILSNGEDDDDIFAQLSILLEKAEFTRTYNKQQILAELRAFYQRAHPTAREQALLKAALHKVNNKMC